VNTNSLRSLYWPLTAFVYWLVAVWILVHVVPVGADYDGRGTDIYSTIYLWHRPWYVRQTNYDESLFIRLQFLSPYLLAAVFIALAGCGTAMLTSSRRLRPFYLFGLSSLVTFLLLISLAILHDAGIMNHIFSGPLLYTHPYGRWLMNKVFLPMSLLSGLSAVGVSFWASIAEQPRSNQRTNGKA
jgi:hypothetical protein